MRFKRARLSARGMLRRIKMMMDQDIPMMRAVSYKTLLDLGTLPAASYGLTTSIVDLLDKMTNNPTAYDMRRPVPIFFVSHVWARPNLDVQLAHPDDLHGSKARALLVFAEWWRTKLLMNSSSSPNFDELVNLFIKF